MIVPRLLLEFLVYYERQLRRISSNTEGGSFGLEWSQNFKCADAGQCYLSTTVCFVITRFFLGIVFRI